MSVGKAGVGVGVGTGVTSRLFRQFIVTKIAVHNTQTTIPNPRITKKSNMDLPSNTLQTEPIRQVVSVFLLELLRGIPDAK